MWQVSSESHHYWLEGLALISRAEELVSREEEEDGAGGGQQERLTSALTTLHRGIATLTAASTAQHNLAFHIQFLRCRAAVLQVPGGGSSLSLNQVSGLLSLYL